MGSSWFLLATSWFLLAFHNQLNPEKVLVVVGMDMSQLEMLEFLDKLELVELPDLPHILPLTSYVQVQHPENKVSII